MTNFSPGDVFLVAIDVFVLFREERGAAAVDLARRLAFHLNQNDMILAISVEPIDEKHPMRASVVNLDSRYHEYDVRFLTKHGIASRVMYSNDNSSLIKL